MKIHPHELLLRELLTAPSDEHEPVIDHLAECEPCWHTLQAILKSGHDPVPANVTWIDHWTRSDAYSSALERAIRPLERLESDAARERAEAPALFAELMEHPAPRWRLLVRNSSRFATLGLFERLLAASRERGFENAAAAESLAQLALELTDQLGTPGPGNERIEDLRARAWAAVGNARRLRFDLGKAEEAFDRAFDHLRKGTRESLEKAPLLDLRASLLRAQLRFDRALSDLRRAIYLYLEAGEKHRAGRALVKMSTVHHAAGDSTQSMEALYQALELIDADREPRLTLCAWHNLIDDLVETGQFLEARRLLAKARPLYREVLQPGPQIARQWVEGKIARGLGHFTEAESFLLAAREGFLKEGAAYDTILVSLDLGVVYASQGRAADLRRLAADLIAVLPSRQIHREVLAALALWQQAVDAEQACVDLAVGVATYVKRARYNPSLRFEVPE